MKLNRPEVHPRNHHSKPLVSVRVMLVLAIVLLWAAMGWANAADAAFEQSMPGKRHPILQGIIEDARQSAAGDFPGADNTLPQGLRDMSYETFRDIRFNADHALWRDRHAFEVQWFHPGFLYPSPVKVNVINSANQAELLPFDDSAFRYEGRAAPLREDARQLSGFAGFRVHFPLNRRDYKDEFLVFLGASYFRLIGEQQVYGLSARGLAIDTGLPEGEEFPRFTEFWLVEPGSDKKLVIYARLESESLSGAYRFVITPGEDSQVEVKAWLFARENVRKLGLAPFTSMFLYGENSPRQVDDFRPEVHDSDGVMLFTSNEDVIWRPLTNPAHLQITSLADTAPKGFGMLQRDRGFDRYLDQEALYHRRPGLWVTPLEGFNQGRLELVEIPTASETHDNIVAYWVNDTPLNKGEALHVHYRLHTLSGNPQISGRGHVVRSRNGRTALPGYEDKDSQHTRRFIVDFHFPDAVTDVDALQLSLDTTHGRVSQARVFPLDADNQLRVTFLLTPEGNNTSDMRLFLLHQDQPISEVWNYVYQPQ